jgi:hypothetical protein
MSIRRYVANKDNTITTAFKSNLTTRATGSNMGASDVLEVFSIYGQATTSSVEKSRVIVQFPVSTISSDRDSGVIPASGSVNFYLRIGNAEHGTTVPESFTMSVLPLLETWEEGLGLDMEEYRNIDASNWIESADNTNWNAEGGTIPIASRLNSQAISLEYTQAFDSGLEDLEVDITPVAEEWIKHYKGNSVAASASIRLADNPAVDETIILYRTDGGTHTFVFATGSSYVSGSTTYVQTGPTVAGTTKALKAQIDLLDYFSATTGSDSQTVDVTQATAGLFGNTLVAGTADITTNHFAGGAGLVNAGLLIKLSGSFEDGTAERSYYTKRFFARGSQFFFKRPNIEARYDLSVQDDRGDIIKSSSLAPAADNLNNIYLYNKIRGNLRDIPNTGSELLVRFVPSLGGTPATVVQSGGVSSTWVTASRNSRGIYKATFAYAGSETTLYDIWQYSGSGGYVELYTGSAFTVGTDSADSYYPGSQFVVNVTNLKPSYRKDEVANFRVYTRSKDWQPNIYTVARNSAPITNIREGYYKITRQADNYTVIPYSTSSAVAYSKLSYDMSGSYFDLDMSILEPNYLYEISFLRKEDSEYIEQKEKFKFRVDP